MNTTKLSDVRAGDILIADEGFTCMRPGAKEVIEDDRGVLFVACACGAHYIDGQADVDGVLVGLAKQER